MDPKTDLIQIAAAALTGGAQGLREMAAGHRQAVEAMKGLIAFHETTAGHLEEMAKSLEEWSEAATLALEQEAAALLPPQTGFGKQGH